MLKKLKRFWLHNKKKVNGGVGFLLCIFGFWLIIKTMPTWIIGFLVGGSSTFLGVHLLKK